ncbi:MAG: 2-hydroxyacyl-CoA dehydratase family protein [Clostridiales bacterium]|nr:2-hydroxyacyl-CoA dehydratase family protein [Clostridiales bacterium]
MDINVNEATSKELLAYYQAKLDQEAIEAKKAGKLVCWSASVAPPEFCVAMDIAMVYPETHAAGAGARKASMDLLKVADQKGYNIDVCSYARTNLGYMELLKQEALSGQTPDTLANSKATRVPLPDLVITCNNICNTLLKWYENLAKELNIPCIVIDVPFNHTMPVSKHNKAYIAEQFRTAIHQLEEICGRPFDYDKFLAAQEQVQRSVYQWNRVAACAQQTPSPLNGFDLFNYMALIVCARARDYAEITFRKFADELEAKAKAGQYAFGGAENEKHRITWEGIAVWPYLGATFKGLKNQGSVMTGSAYPGLWNLTYTPGDLESMAEAYTNVYINTCGPNRYEEFLKVVQSSKSEGVVLHLNRSCKLMSLLNNEGAEYVSAKLGVPYVSFDGDQTDPRVFSQAQYETRVQALSEMMDEKQQDTGRDEK